MKRSVIRGCITVRENPDYASLHPGYACSSITAVPGRGRTHRHQKSVTGHVQEAEDDEYYRCPISCSPPRSGAVTAGHISFKRVEVISESVNLYSNDGKRIPLGT
jgi:hypothetical protein